MMTKTRVTIEQRIRQLHEEAAYAQYRVNSSGTRETNCFETDRGLQKCILSRLGIEVILLPQAVSLQERDTQAAE